MSVEMKSAPADQAMRDRFVQDLDRNAVVEAGAGTGKTTLVVQRILALVCGTEQRPGIEIGRIAAVTFTEAAAAELGQRVRDGLTSARAEALAGGDGEMAQRLGRAIGDLSTASISTIHGFTQGILRENALEADLDPSFEVMGAVARQRLVEEVFELWFEGVADQPAVRRALSFGFKLSDLEKIARDMMDLGPGVLDTQAPEIGDLPGAIGELFVQVDGLRERFGPVLGDSANEFDLQGERLVNLLQALGALLEDHAGLRGAPGEMESEAFELELMTPRWSKGGVGGSIGGGKWAKALGGKAGDYKEIYTELCELVVKVRAMVGARVALDLEPVLRSFRASFDQEKQRRSVLDFDDLLVRAEHLVRTNSGVRKAVMQRFDTLFVDEFQDTDPVQARLVFFLSGAAGSEDEQDWRQVPPAPGRLVLVGDPKQSIYRFRKADVVVYRECCDLAIAADPEARFEITTNFRTDGALVDFVNGCFESGPAKMQAPAGESYQADYIGLVPHHKTRGVEAPVLALVQDEEDARRGSDKNLTAEAGAVARFLVTKVKPGLKVGDGAVVELGDVAVLARTRATLAVYCEALAKHGIDFVVEGGGSLFAEREVKEALCLLTAIFETGRSTAVVGALRSVWFGICDDDLATHKLDGGGWDPAGELTAGSELVNGALGQLRDWGAEAALVDPRLFVESLLGDPKIEALLRLRASGAQAVMDLRRLVGFVIELLDSGGLGLAGAVRFCVALSRAGSDESGARIAAKGAVRLMTVHSSKGLEFGLVILGQPAREQRSQQGEKPWLEGDQLIWRLGAGFEHPGFKDKCEREVVREKAELLRLYYVALTRAAHFLLVPVFAPADTRSKVPKGLTARIAKGAFGKLLGPAFGTGDAYEETAGVAHIAVEEAGSGSNDDPGLELVLGELERELKSAEASEPGAARRLRLDARVESVGVGLSFGPSMVADGGGHSGGLDDGELARRVGTFVHLAIENRLDTGAAASAAVAQGFDPDSVEFISECVAAEARLDSHARAFADGARVRDEVPVMWPGVHGMQMHAFIDRLIEFEDGSVEVVDFKTDRFDAADADELDARVEHHMVQLALYGLALEAAGLKVRALTLAFLASEVDVSWELDEQLRTRALAAVDLFRKAQSVFRS